MQRGIIHGHSSTAKTVIDIKWCYEFSTNCVTNFQKDSLKKNVALNMCTSWAVKISIAHNSGLTL